VDKTDIALILAAFSALTILFGATAALVTAAFVAGRLPGQRRQTKR
jgi:hypothetical protein